METQWQPIEMAPHDEWVLLKGGTQEYLHHGPTDEDLERTAPFVVAKYEGFEVRSIETDASLCLQDEPTFIWRYTTYDSGIYGRYYNPTHWKRVE